MIISFIKVGLMIGLTSIGGAIYQTFKSAKEYDIEIEIEKNEEPIKLLRATKNEVIEIKEDILKNTNILDEIDIDTIDNIEINKKI